MDDLDIEALRSSWRDATEDAELHMHLIRHRRWLPTIALVAEVGGATLAAILGGWLIWLGMHTHNGAYSTIGAPLFACGISLAIVLADARRDSLGWRDERPGDLLETGLRQVEASVRVMSIMRWYAVGLLFLLFGACGVNLMAGKLPALGAWLATSGGMTVCAVYWLWLTARRQTKLKERSAIARLLLEEREAEFG